LKRAAGLVLALVGVIATAWLLERLCWSRYLCDIEHKRIENETIRILDRPDTFAVRQIAERNVRVMSRCIKHSPTVVNLYMIQGANLRILNRHNDAAAAYRQALRYDRRSELFFNLGITQLAAGQRAPGEDTLVTACLMYYDYWAQIPEPSRARVLSRVNPLLGRLHRGQATQEDLAILRERMVRDPS